MSAGVLHPIREVASETAFARVDADLEDLWGRLVDEAQGADFVRAWLVLQCRAIGSVRRGLVLFETADSTALAPVAVWPEPTLDLSGLQDVAEQAVREGRGFTRFDLATGHSLIAYPIVIADHVSGLVVLQLEGAGEEATRSALRDLHWGIGWLEAQVLRRRSDEDRGRLGRASAALDILAVAGEHARVETAAMAVANELASRLLCDRVALGLAVVGRGGRYVKLVGLANTAWFRRKSALVTAIENAMEEALDQDATVAYPHIPSTPRPITVAHRTLCDSFGASAVITVPMSHRGAPIGLMTLERREGALFSRDDALVLEALADLLGPLLDLKRRQRRWLTGRAPELVSATWRLVFGARRPGAKLAALALLAAIALLLFYPAPLTVTANAVLEGAQQRAAVAPFAGIVAKAPVRAGDLVRQDDTLALMDDKDLRLDLGKWKAEYAQMLQERRKALATFDRAEVALVDARLEQAKAQLDLTTLKLERTQIRAPIDGIVISGDWSQKIGAPIEQGIVMFELSPLESYRVNLKVEESDVGLVRPGQSGTLLLAGRADASIPFTITRIASVAGMEDGRNLFRVEATLPAEAQAIRPGMEGIGKIEVATDKLWWVLGRRLVDWSRLFIFRHLP